jgi:hypothetical protein
VQHRTRQVRCRWGTLAVPVTQYRHRETGAYQTAFEYDELDHSGWLPRSLAFVLEMGTELPPGIAAMLCQQAGFNVSRAELDRLLSAFGGAVREQRHTQLSQRAFEPLASSTGPTPGRVMVAQLDGCIVLSQPENGQCTGIEVKAVLVYPQQAPTQRVMHADVRPIAEFQPACAGLLREAGVRSTDTLVGLGDGAPWVASTLRLMGAHVVLDVFHAVSYLDVVMEHLGWNDELRRDERRAWLRGECDAQQWLTTHLPPPERRQTWTEAGSTAARYLLERVDQMHYPTYRAAGWPIGSGQIEGANKSVIGHRLKRAGQHWSRPGAGGMAALRARATSVSRPLPFAALRHRAFPPLHS